MPTSCYSKSVVEILERAWQRAYTEMWRGVLEDSDKFSEDQDDYAVLSQDEIKGVARTIHDETIPRLQARVLNLGELVLYPENRGGNDQRGPRER